MNNTDIYKIVNEGVGHNTPSYVSVLSADQGLLDMNTIKERLLTCSDIDQVEIEQKSKGEIALSKRRMIYYAISLKYKDKEYQFKLLNKIGQTAPLNQYIADASIDASELEREVTLPNSLESSFTYNIKHALEDFFVQLLVMKLLAPNAELIIDNSSKRLFPKRWLDEITTSKALPSPNFLYTIKTLKDEEAETYWIRTEGLNRCSSIELEMIDIKGGVNELIGLLNNIANDFIYHTPAEDEKFELGYDGLTIHLCWMRWENGIKQFNTEAFGGFKNRNVSQQDINPYQGPSGIILGVEEGLVTSPELYISTLKQNPTYVIKEQEIDRISKVAKEKFKEFEKLFLRHKNEEDWVFLVQLGTPITIGEEEKVEHLWYKVENKKAGALEIMLINEPYWVPEKNKGEMHQMTDLSQLTNWAIYHDHAKYSPDTIYAFTDNN